jgi:hypothetical protein
LPDSAGSQTGTSIRHTSPDIWYSRGMSQRKRSSTKPSGIVLAELAWASWETIVHRSVLMMTGQCSAAEYQQMMHEKTAAGLKTGQMLLAGDHLSMNALLAPWHSRATANAKRLRKPRPR